MKRGRPSVAEQTVIPLAPARRRLQPPADLDENEARLFRDVVASCAPEHFVASDAPLLATYVQSVLLSRRAAADLAADPRALSRWERVTGMQASLALRLRLAPSSRSHPERVARRAAAWSPPSAYEAEDEWPR
jgi:hypothetical protein